MGKDVPSPRGEDDGVRDAFLAGFAVFVDVIARLLPEALACLSREDEGRLGFCADGFSCGLSSAISPPPRRGPGCQACGFSQGNDIDNKI